MFSASSFFYLFNMKRSLKVITAGDAVLTLSEVKLHLKIDSSADDALITNLISAATESCQEYTNRYFTTTVVEQYSDTFAGVKQLYKSPVISITHIKYYDSNNSLQTWDTANYIVDNVSEPARIGLEVQKAYPEIADRMNAVVVKYSVGYGTAADVPQVIKSAILLTIGNLYENRQSVITGRTATELPLSSQYLLNQFKVQVC